MSVFKKVFFSLVLTILGFTLAACNLEGLFGNLGPSTETNVTLVYHGNSNTAGDVPAPVQYATNSEVTVADNTGNLVRNDNEIYVFAGWNSSSDGLGTDYPVGSTFTLEHDMLLYAKWTTENQTQRYVTLTKIRIKPVVVDEYVATFGYDCDPLYWDSENLKLNSFKISFGAIGYQAPGFWLEDDFPTQQGVAYTIDDMEYTNIPLGIFSDYVITNNSNYFKLPISTANTFTFGSSSFIDIFTKPINTEPAIIPIAKTGGSLIESIVHENVFVESGILEITVLSQNLTLMLAGLHSFDMEFVFQVSVGAMPEEDTYNITYDGNGVTTNVPVDNMDYYNGLTATVKAKGNMDNSGYIFTGWNTNSDGSGTSYNADDAIVMTNNVTLYAQWEGLITASIKGKSIKDIELNGSVYSAANSVALTNNYEYGMTAYLYVDQSVHTTLKISDFVSFEILPAGAVVSYEYLKNTTPIGFDDPFDVPVNNNTQVGIQVKVLQGTTILDVVMIYVRRLPI